MADMQTALRGRLVADASLSNLIVGRVYWNIVPQNVAPPYVVLTTISDPRPEHLEGYDTARTTRVQADCVAQTYAIARQTAEAIVAAVATPGTHGGVVFGRVKAEGPADRGQDIDGVGFIHNLSLDLIVEHRLA